jgi:flavin-dependent dehydrogenase
MPSKDGNKDIADRTEFGPSDFPPQDNYQIDRGLFENELAARAQYLGVEVMQGCRVQNVDFGADSSDHTIAYTQGEAEASLHARWVVDAAGRASFLKRKLDLAKEIEHTINSSWLRLRGGLDLEKWGYHDREWVSKMSEPGLRQYSTNHLLGEGYWVWLIPLSSGPISIGVCADPRFHPWEEISSFEAWMDWLKRNEPQLHAEIDGRREDVMDFLRVQDYSYGSTRFFSADRWTLVGEAGAFLDALYSPGSDFIGFSNTFSCELIERELDGEDITELADFYNDFYLSLFNTTAHLYRDNFQLFGNPQVMVAKFVYDSSTYFSGIGNAWCHDKMRKPEDIEKLGEILHDAIQMLPVMQQLFRDWNAIEQTPFEGVSVLPKQLEPYIQAQADMARPAGNGSALPNRNEGGPPWALACVPVVALVALALVARRRRRSLATRPAIDDPR